MTTAYRIGNLYGYHNAKSPSIVRRAVWRIYDRHAAYGPASDFWAGYSDGLYARWEEYEERDA